MKKVFTAVSLLLLLTVGATEALGENPSPSARTLDIELTDSGRIGLLSIYERLDMVGKFSQIWKLKLDAGKTIKNQNGARARPALTLGAFSDALLNYQPDTILQWGHSFRNLILSLRFGVKADGLNEVNFKHGSEVNDLFNLNLNFNFLIDVWFK